MFSVNPTGQIAAANVGIDQGQKSLVTAETKDAASGFRWTWFCWSC
jgi:hypothetical protein